MCKKNKCHNYTLLEQLFSVRNEYKNGKKRKVIKLLGVTITLKKNPHVFLNKNTFLIWEPCFFSHAEIVPGYAKYLIELGFDVSILLHPNRLKEGLFSHFKHKKLHLTNLSYEEIPDFLSKCDLNKTKGMLITTARNASDDNSTYNEKYKLINNPDKVFLVEHEIKPPIDNGFWNDEIITLAPMNYKNQVSIVVNPNYFGNFKKHSKNETVNFIVVGAFDASRKNFNLLFDAVKEINDKNFKVTVVGNGDFNCIPKEIAHYFEIKGRLKYNQMYDCINSADYLLALFDKNNKNHYRYITTRTSGSYQLSYGFLKPLIIEETFCKNRFLNDKNAIVYSENNLVLGMKEAIRQKSSDYDNMVAELERTVYKIREISKNNLEKLINSRCH